MIARYKVAIIIVFLIGVMTGIMGIQPLLYAEQIDDSNNPLASGKVSLYQTVVLKYWNYKIENCLTDQDKDKLMGCLNDNIKTMTEQKGVRFALDVVEPLAQKYPKPLLTLSHEFAHLIGDYALDHDYRVEKASHEEDGFTPGELELIARIGKALVDCDGWGAFGCYHGVIEVGLSRLRPEDRTRVIRKACTENELIQQHRAYVNQCLHWFGHGMAVFTDQPLSETLRICDELNPESFPSDDVQLCISGVFHAGAVPGEVDEEYNHYISRVYSPTDPFYPCQEVENKYKGQCYSQLVGRSGEDFEVQFQNCNTIPESNPEARSNYIKRCYNSGANNLLVHATFDVDTTIRLCQEHSLPEYLGDCYGGTIRYSILRDPLLNNPFPFELCGKIEVEHKPMCYRSLGAANYENYFDEQLLNDYCNRVESKYREDCMSKDPLQLPVVVEAYTNL